MGPKAKSEAWLGMSMHTGCDKRTELERGMGRGSWPVGDSWSQTQGVAGLVLRRRNCDSVQVAWLPSRMSFSLQTIAHYHQYWLLRISVDAIGGRTAAEESSGWPSLISTWSFANRAFHWPLFVYSTGLTVTKILVHRILWFIILLKYRIDKWSLISLFKRRTGSTVESIVEG